MLVYKNPFNPEGFFSDIEDAIIDTQESIRNKIVDCLKGNLTDINKIIKFPPINAILLEVEKNLIITRALSLFRDKNTGKAFMEYLFDIKYFYEVRTDSGMIYEIKNDYSNFMKKLDLSRFVFNENGLNAEELRKLIYNLFVFKGPQIKEKLMIGLSLIISAIDSSFVEVIEVK